jgi:hypothetical protein
VLHQILTGLIIALGCLHVGFTPFNYSHFDLDAMWFLSAGVAIILAGFLNVALIRVGKDRVSRSLCVLTNASFAILFGVALFQMPQPQVLVRSYAFCRSSGLQPSNWRPEDTRFCLTLDSTPDCKLAVSLQLSGLEEVL